MRQGFRVKKSEQTKETPWLTPPKKFKRVHSAGKVMVSIFWYCQGVIMINYLDQGRTINGDYHAGELRRLCQESQERGEAN